MSATTPNATANGRHNDGRWHIDPKILVALAGLLIGLGSGYWGRELVSQTNQEKCFTEVREEIAQTKMLVVSLEARMLEMRLKVNDDVDEKVRRASDEYREDVKKLDEKLSAISAQIVELKLQVTRLGQKVPAS